MCAFDENGIFTDDNWSCKLMTEVRGLMNQHTNEEESDFCPYGKCWWDEDQYQGVLYVPYWINGELVESRLKGKLISISWYKSRGRTDSFMIIDTWKNKLGTEDDALELIKLFSKWNDYDLSRVGE